MNDQPFEHADDNRRTGRQLVSTAEAVPAALNPYGGLASYHADLAYESAQSSDLSLLEYFRIFSKRKWLILGIAAAFVILAAIRTLMQVPIYTSTVRLQVDRVAKLVEGSKLIDDGGDDEFMRTQFELLEGRTMAERVVSALKLGDDWDFLRPRGFSILGAVTGMFSGSPADRVGVDEADARAAGVVMANRAVGPVPNSRLIDVNYSDPDPARAQRVANAFADAFVAANIDKRFQETQTAKVFLEDKLQQLKRKLQESEAAQIDFAKKQQVISLSSSAGDAEGRASIAETNLSDATAELAKLVSERTRNEVLWHQVENANFVDLPSVLSDATISALRGQRTQLEIDYQEKLKTYKPGFPTMVQARAKTEEIDRQLTDQLKTIRDSLKAEYEMSLVREKAMAERVALLKGEVLDLQKQSIQYNFLKREVETNRDLYNGVLQSFKEVDVAGGTGINNVFVVERALPGAPVSRSLFSALLKALLLGLGIGIAISYFLEKLDDKIHSAEQLEQITGLPVLGLIPKVSHVDEEAADIRSAFCEANRSLCTALQFTTENGLPKTLLITSAGPSEGKSVTSLAIAKHFAMLGRKVLLIDADLRNPSLHVTLGRENCIGLSTYLTGACTPPEAMQRIEGSNLAFIASGPLPPNAADLLGGTRIVSLLSIGSEVFDLIVIDGPPILGLADTLLLSSATSATIFIAGAGGARKKFIHTAFKRLQLSRCSVIGAVLTKYDAKNSSYGYDYGYDYYQRGYNADPRGLSIAHYDRKQPQLGQAHESV